MADLPDVHCWVKVLDATDKVVPDGGSIVPQWNAVVRYIVANDSNKPSMKASALSSKKRQTSPLWHGEGLSRAPAGRSSRPLTGPPRAHN
jgi:hypothetical protein